MTVTATPYGQALIHLGNARFNFASDTFNVLLTTSSYTPNVDTHDYLDDITNEIVGTGYTAGGETLTGLAWTYDTATNTAKLIADATVWSTASFTCRRAVVYKDTGVAATSPLLSYVDFGIDESPASIDFVINWASTGLISAALV